MLIRVVRRVVYFIDSVSSVGVHVAAAVALIGVIMIVAEVVIRYGQLAKVTFADELSGYFFAFICFASAADAMREGSFIRLTFITKRFGRKIQNALMVLAYVLGLVVVGILTYQFWGYFMQSVELGSTSVSILRIPLSIPQVFIVIGAGLLWLQLLILAVRGLIALITGREFGSSNPE